MYIHAQTFVLCTYEYKNVSNAIIQFIHLKRQLDSSTVRNAKLKANADSNTYMDAYICMYVCSICKSELIDTYIHTHESNAMNYLPE